MGEANIESQGCAHAESLLTVGMVVYNGAKFISQAIESVLVQDHPDFELLIMDDGSTDGTDQIIAGFADPRIRWSSTEHFGVAAARNRVVQEARGDYIVWLDHDDILLPQALASYAKLAAGRPEVAVFYGDLEVIDAERITLGHRHYQNLAQRRHLFAQLLSCNLVPMPGTMVKRTVFADVGGYDENLQIAEDYDLWLRIVAAGKSFVHSGRTVVRYRWHGSNLSADRRAITQGELSIISRMIARHDLRELFPDLDWREESKSFALAFALLSQVFRQRGDVESAVAWRKKSEAFAAPEAPAA